MATRGHDQTDLREQTATATTGEQLRWVPVDALLDEPPFPPREGDPALDFLLSSVKIHGVLTPLCVRTRAGGLQVVCGYRRLLAARSAGLTEVPVVVREMEDVEAVRVYLSENVCRRDLTTRAREECLRLLRRLRDGMLPEEHPHEDGFREGGPKGHGFAGGAGRTRETSARTAPRPAGASGAEDRAPSARPERASSRSAEANVRISTTDARELLRQTRTLLDDVRRSRRIDGARAQAIVDRLVGLQREGQPLRAEDVYVDGATGAEGWLAEHCILCASWNLALCPPDNGPELRKQYALAGLLHDVGMVFLGERAYLSEPRALSPGQRAEVQGHTRLGHALVSGLGAVGEEVSDAVRDHHERHDGSGYPRGARAEALGALSRVTALVDTLASLVGRRPHRNSLRLEAAIERLERATEMGLYDPRMVQRLRALVGRWAPATAPGEGDPAPSRARGVPAWTGNP